jgi:HPt (histidine-containing phosphotransfer) domain-containing protein
MFTTTVHAMKSALANVGENEKSHAAAALEQASLNGDGDFIAAYTEDFVKTLESLIREISKITANVTDADAAVAEDTAYLHEQLQFVKTACEYYDDTAAYNALDRIKEKPWNPRTVAALEKIRDMLFLHSDFDGAAEQAEALCNERIAENA